MCGAKGMVFYPFWSEIWYQFWPFWSEKRVWFVHFSLNLELGMFFRRSYFFIIRRACYALIDLRVKSEIGYGKSEILVWNRERVSGSVSHTPTQFSWRHPPPPRRVYQLIAPAAMLVPKSFLQSLEYEKLHWPESWRGSLHIYLVSYARFWT